MSDLESQLNDHEKVLYDSHKEMNSIVVSKLVSSGFKIGDEVDAEYYFISDALESISELHHHLKEKYEYITKASKTSEGKFVLEGLRPNLTLTEGFTNRWCLNMIVIGGDFGCDFGGWGVRH